jgi:hypothetical protein
MQRNAASGLFTRPSGFGLTKTGPGTYFGAGNATYRETKTVSVMKTVLNHGKQHLREMIRQESLLA